MSNNKKNTTKGRHGFTALPFSSDHEDLSHLAKKEVNLD